MSTWPQLLGEGQKDIRQWDRGPTQSPRGLDGRGDVAGRTPGAYLATTLPVVVVMLGQHEDQLKVDFHE